MKISSAPVSDIKEKLIKIQKPFKNTWYSDQLSLIFAWCVIIYFFTLK